MKIEYQSIGTIHSPFTELNSMPIQPTGAIGIKGHLEILPEYADGLKDIDGFSHIILLYHFHQSKNFQLNIIPFLDTVTRGVFSTRAPKRPNAIGFSVVKLSHIQNNILHIENVDILDGTPLLDIKPYVAAFDVQTDDVRIGWLENTSNNALSTKSDKRFI
jgi:tRNA (adenine37-N6)-methyltransferase